MISHCKRNIVSLSHLYTYSTVPEAAYSRTDYSSNLQPKPFEDIPGPRSLPVVGTLYKYLPLIGDYSFTELHKTGLKKYKEFGPLVREEIVKGIPTVWIYRPEDIEKTFQIDTSRHPQRRSHLALYKYRKDRSSIYNSGGLLPTNGTEWWRLRKELQKDLSKPQNISFYLQDIDKFVREFVLLCKTQEECNDFLPYLSRLFLKLIYLVTFDIELDCFSEDELKKDSVSSQLIDAAFTTNSVVLKLDNGPQLWRYFNTPLYKKLVKAQNFMEKVAVDMVSQKEREISLNKESSNSLLKMYLQNPELDKKDVIGMTCDLLLAGIDTISYTSAFALYHLAKNQKCQEKLYEESKFCLKNKNDEITTEILRKATYTKAVLKETFRLNPISVGIGRILQCDTVLNGYQVPKGVVAVTQNQIICRLPEYFKNPNSFVPDRWLRNCEHFTKVNPYLILPFGHGPRSCIARRLAEQNLQVFLLRMIRNFKITWKGGLLNTKSLLINVPSIPINIKLEKRNL